MSPKEINSAGEFYEAIRQGVCLVDFNAPWCAPCKLQEPIIDNLTLRFQGKASIYGLNVDQLPHLAMNCNISSIPTLIIFRDGKEIERILGLQTEIVICHALNRALEKT